MRPGRFRPVPSPSCGEVSPGAARFLPRAWGKESPAGPAAPRPREGFGGEARGGGSGASRVAGVPRALRGSRRGSRGFVARSPSRVGLAASAAPRGVGAEVESSELGGCCDLYLQVGLWGGKGEENLAVSISFSGEFLLCGLLCLPFATLG